MFTLFLGFTLGVSTEANAQSKLSRAAAEDGKSMEAGIEKVLISSQPSAVIQLKKARGKNSYIVYTGKAQKTNKQQPATLSDCDGCIKWTKVDGGMLTNSNRDRRQPSAVRTKCYPDSDFLKVVVMTACDDCVTVSFKDCKGQD